MKGMKMLTSKLYEQVLIDPVLNEQADSLFIVSGYASPSMAFQQLNQLREAQKSISVSVIFGMAPVDCVPRASHDGFVKLMDEDFTGKFSCSYLNILPPVHSKVYVWSKNGTPLKAYQGSANYTLTGFGKTSRRQNEILDICDPADALAYYKKIEENSIFCVHADAEDYVTDRVIIERTEVTDDARETLGESVRLSFISRKENDVPARSSLNWGQRPELGREPNQAYIPIPSKVNKTNFFPPIGVFFTVYTDDNRILLCVRAQEKGKAIQTPQNNSLIGEYFRSRLGLANGALVTRADLERYGRTDVTFTKIDDETFYMDFSV